MPDANLTPEQAADVRRLLAEARHTDPMPDLVAARLDRVLAQLADGDGSHDPVRVDELASRRRRRASTLLVAATAIVAVGVGLGQVVDRAGGGGGSADSAVTADGAAPRDSAAEKAPTASARTYALDGAPRPHGVLPEVRSRRFTTDVRRAGMAAGVRLHSGLLQQTADQVLQLYSDAIGVPQPAPGASTPHTDSPQGGDDNAASNDMAATASGAGPASGTAGVAYDCKPAPYGPGRKVAVLYDGDPAVLVFRHPTGDTRIVDLLECGTGDVLRSVTLAR